MKLRGAYMPMFLTTLILVALCICSCASAKDSKNPSEDSLNMYAEVINDYKRIVAFRLSPGFEEAYNKGSFVELHGDWAKDIYAEVRLTEEDSIRYRWHCMLVDMLDSVYKPDISSFGYILSDLDNDGTQELFWVTSNRTVLAVFTVKNNQVRIVDAYHPKHQCVVLDSGELYTKSTGAANYYEYAIETLDSSSDSLLKTSIRFGKNENVYFIDMGGYDQTVTEDAYVKIYSEHPWIMSDYWKKQDIWFLGQRDSLPGDKGGQ